MMQSKKKKKATREFGELRFDYIKGITHEIGQGQGQGQNGSCRCPLCKLAGLETRKFFKEEQALVEQKRATSLLNRAKMRAELLINWSRTHSQFYADVFPTPHVDIMLSKSVAELIGALSADQRSNLNLDELEKILARRERIKEVGEFAACYIQSRVRKFLTREAVRRNMLKRFEFVPATKRKPAFFVDNLKSQKWDRYPQLLLGTAPITPRTIERRLNAQRKTREARLEKFHAVTSTRRATADDGGDVFNNEDVSMDVFEREDRMISILRQFVIFRDVIALAMGRVTAKVVASQAEQAENLAASRAKVGGEPLAPTVTKLEKGALHPVWMCVSAPATPSRLLGLAMALEKDPPLLGRGTGDDVQNSNSNPNAPPSTPSDKTQINRLLQILEMKAWECLRCTTPTEVLSKVLFAELVPTVLSVLNIAQDSNGIYNAALNFRTERRLVEMWTAPITREDIENDKRAAKAKRQRIRQQRLRDGLASDSDDEKEEEQKPMFVLGDVSEHARVDDGRVALYGEEVLPLSIQLSPCFDDRSPNGLFRLFFFNEELVGVCQLSPWAFYPEMYKVKDQVLSSIKVYTESKTTKSFIHEYLSRVSKLAKNSNDPSISLVTGEKEDGSGLRKRNSNMIQPKRYPLSHGLFVPPDDLIFDVTTEERDRASRVISYQTNEEEIVAIGRRYGFLRKNEAFHKLHMKAEAKVTRQHLKTIDKKLPPAMAKKKASEEARLEQEKAARWTAFETQSGSVEGVALMGAGVFKVIKQRAFDAAEKERMKKAEKDARDRSKAVGAGGGRQAVAVSLESDGDEKGDSPPKTVVTMPSIYAAKLAMFGTDVNTDLQSRVDVSVLRNPSVGGVGVAAGAGAGVAAATGARVSSSLHPDGVVQYTKFPLLVLDINVTLPRPILKTKKNILAENLARQASAVAGAVAEGGDAPTARAVDAVSESTQKQLAEKKAAEVLFPIDVHQIVGVFSTDNNRPPPNLDCGLFAWSHFHNIGRPKTAAGTNANSKGGNRSSSSSISSISSSSSSSNNNNVTKDQTWSLPNGATSVSTYRAALSSGKEFRMLVLGAPLPRDRLLEVLPRKAQLWVGLIESDK